MRRCLQADAALATKQANAPDRIEGRWAQPLKRAEEELDEARRYRRAAADCRAMIASGQLTSCQVQVDFQGGRLISIGEAERRADRNERAARQLCQDIGDQLERDRTAVEREQRNIDAGQQELAEWTRRNQEAERNALEAGLELLFNSLGGDLDQLSKSVSAYKGWLTRRQNLLAEKRGAEQVKEALRKFDRALQQYEVQRARLATARNTRFAFEVRDMFELARSTFADQLGRIGSTSEEVRTAFAQYAWLQDEIRPDVDRDLILARKAIEEMGPSALGKRYARIAGPAADLGSFVVNYGYNATAWYQSRERILQQYNLSDQNLRAVASLKRQIENTVRAMNACRALSR